MAFFIWFAISPLLSEIRSDLGLTKKQIWTSSIAGVGSTIAVRFLLGPLCDKYGARVLFSAVLCFASIPTACTGLVQTASQLYILRAFIGVAGGTFVMCQYWTSVLFAKDVVGTANALVGGWGNLGAGVTQLVMGRYVTTRAHECSEENSYHPEVAQLDIFLLLQFLIPTLQSDFRGGRKCIGKSLAHG